MKKVIDHARVARALAKLDELAARYPQLTNRTGPEAHKVKLGSNPAMSAFKSGEVIDVRGHRFRVRRITENDVVMRPVARDTKP